MQERSHKLRTQSALDIASLFTATSVLTATQGINSRVCPSVRQTFVYVWFNFGWPAASQVPAAAVARCIVATLSEP